MTPSNKTCLALALVAACVPALHAQSLSDRVSFSGFGTAAAVVTDDDAMYIREQEAKGAGKRPSMMVDSNLGLKASAQFTPWLSATVQTLTAQESAPHLVTRLDWAYLKATPSDDLTLRAGKLNIPNFMISDSRRIGYANTALRPANEVYGLDYLNGGLLGAEADYRLKVGDNDLTTSVLAGSGTYHDVGINTVRFHRIYGINAVYDGGWYQLRLGHVETRDTDFGAFGQFLQMGVPPGTDISRDIYRFSGIGLSAERAGVIVQAEGVQRSSRLFNEVIGAKAWYALVGYRMNSVIPYVQVARRLPHTANALSVFPQKTTALGLRWDALSKADVKLQLEHIDTYGGNGASFSYLGARPAASVNTASVAVDFVF